VNQTKYIGMDVHQATISVALMDSTGKLILESILETKGSDSAVHRRAVRQLAGDFRRRNVGRLVV
jgi:hypothetical protein